MWRRGDVIGCLADMNNDKMSFSMNGQSMGEAFTGFVKKGLSLLPGLTMKAPEYCHVNLGQRPFKYP